MSADHYELLGVPRDADHDEIRHAYRVKLQLCHPDRHSGSSPDVLSETSCATEELTAAWRILGNPRSHAFYDNHLRWQACADRFSHSPSAPAQRQGRASAGVHRRNFASAWRVFGQART